MIITFLIMGLSTFLGFDFGTSGARLSIINSSNQELYNNSILWNNNNLRMDDAKSWTQAIDVLLQQVQAADQELLNHAKAVCVSGTSATCVLLDGSTGEVVSDKAKMYNYDVSSEAAGNDVMVILKTKTPEKHTVRAPTSSLAKLLSWLLSSSETDRKYILSHQADYLSLYLRYGDSDGQIKIQEDFRVISDWHNCLKLGYDVRSLEWPKWLGKCLNAAGFTEDVLPRDTVSPGSPVGKISSFLVEKFGLPEGIYVIAGTTDSNAAFFAAAGTETAYGTCVTSLGSTLAMKQLSSTFVENASLGVYSHRFPIFDKKHKDEGKNRGEDFEETEAWLVGGASNVGCAVLRHLNYSNGELEELSRDIDFTTDSELNYYPLIEKGERFPIADSEKKPIMEPVPEDRGEFLKAILQGISCIERDGFIALGELGATPKVPTNVLTCGGGSKNDMWINMRQRILSESFQKHNIKVKRAANTEASFGAALLAAASFAVD